MADFCNIDRHDSTYDDYQDENSNLDKYMYGDPTNYNTPKLTLWEKFKSLFGYKKEEKEVYFEDFKFKPNNNQPLTRSRFKSVNSRVFQRWLGIFLGFDHPDQVGEFLSRYGIFYGVPELAMPNYIFDNIEFVKHPINNLDCIIITVKGRSYCIDIESNVFLLDPEPERK